MEILKVENLVKTYGKGETKINAVDDISFTINKGEFVAIVGASGSGKSTLLHLIGGVDRPTSGKVYIDGKDIYALNNDNLAIFRRRQIGLIYQFYNLIPILNVEENITLPYLLLLYLLVLVARLSLCFLRIFQILLVYTRPVIGFHLYLFYLSLF